MTIAIDQDAPPLRVDETGTIRIGTSRITLDLLVEAHGEGLSPEEIVRRYDTLALPDVYAAIAYYLRPRDALDPYLAERQRQAEELRQQIESSPGYQQRKDDLLRRARERMLR